jgi:hypothetical protein
MAMSTQLPERFYRLLYFSPRPEDEEQVCVGIVLRDGSKTYLDFDDKLEKAHCLAPDYTRESFAFILNNVKNDVSSLAETGKLVELSPQFKMSAPRTLLHPIDASLRSVLRQKYLLKPKAAPHGEREKGIERKIDKLLTEKMGVASGVNWHRRATVDDLLDFGASRQLPPDLVPKPVARALSVGSGICLIDGVDLHTSSSDLLISRISRVVHTFWQYDQAKEFLPGLRDKQLLRAAILFDGNGSNVEEAFHWRADYARHEFKENADLIVKAGSTEEESAMQDRVTSLLTSGA